MTTKTYTVRYKFDRLTGAILGWAAGLTGGAGCLLTGIAFISAFPAWITHVVVCFKDGEWGFLIAGALFFPVAVIHGWGIWFGWWG